jgi:serine/threonine protein kinase
MWGGRVQRDLHWIVTATMYSILTNPNPQSPPNHPKGRVPPSFVNMFASNFLAQVSDLRKDFDKSKEIEVFKSSSGDTTSNMSRNNIEPSLLVDSFELEFERDEKGQFISLGKGAFGNVLLADYHGTKCAYKEILPSSLSQETLERFFLELKLIGTLRHPNIAQCLGVVWELEDHGIMFELCKNGGLDDFLKGQKEHVQLLSWQKTPVVLDAHDKIDTTRIKKGSTLSILINQGIGLKTKWALGVAKGCAFLHGKNPPIVHRDLKCANVLISDDLTAKITDFGESRHLGSEEDEEKTMTTVGTPYFMAPEVFSSDDVDRMYSKEVDVYSYGMLLLEIFYDGDIKKAFRKGWGPMVVMSRVGNGWRPDLKLVEAEDKDLADLMRKCWDKVPKERPAFKEMIKLFQKKLIMLDMETSNMKGLLMKQNEKEDKPRTIEPVHNNKLVAAKPRKRAGTEVHGVGIKPSFLDGLLNDGIMPEPLEVKQSKVSFKVEDVKTKSEEDKEKESDKDENESSGSGMTMLLAGLKYEG